MREEREQYKGLSKRIEYVLARGLICALRLLPMGIAHGLGRGLGWLLWATLTARRRAVRKNLKIITEWATWNDRGDLFKGFNADEQVREVFKRTAANIICGFSLSGMSQQKLARHVEFKGGELLREATVNGQGAVLLLCHMGPWEALAHLPGLFRAQEIENPLGAIYRKFNNDYIEEWYKDLRESKGTKMFGSRYKFYAPVEFVRQGGILGVVSDQRASGGEKVQYFGKPTYCTPLPGLIHLRSKSPWFALSLGTVSKHKWRITIHQVPSHLEGLPRNRKALAQTVANSAEESFSMSMLDGFWINNRFKACDEETDESQTHAS